MLTLNDGRSELWQWDTGRTLAVDADCSQVHFSNKLRGPGPQQYAAVPGRVHMAQDGVRTCNADRLCPTRAPKGVI